MPRGHHSITLLAVLTILICTGCPSNKKERPTSTKPPELTDEQLSWVRECSLRRGNYTVQHQVDVCVLKARILFPSGRGR